MSSPTILPSRAAVEGGTSLSVELPPVPHQDLMLPPPSNPKESAVASASMQTHSAEELHQLVVLHAQLHGRTTQGEEVSSHLHKAQELLLRLETQFQGTALAIAANAEFHALRAGTQGTPMERQSNWQTALQSLSRLQSQFPDDPVTKSTLAHLARYSFTQADQAGGGAVHHGY